MTNFTIDPSSLASVTIHKEWMTDAYNKMSDEEKVFSILKGENHQCSMTSSDDHPEFKTLRERLGNEGFIKIERGWWNGDIVTKPFTLNGAKFKKGEQFSSGAAIKYTVESKIKTQKAKIT